MHLATALHVSDAGLLVSELNQALLGWMLAARLHKQWPGKNKPDIDMRAQQHICWLALNFQACRTMHNENGVWEWIYDPVSLKVTMHLCRLCNPISA